MSDAIISVPLKGVPKGSRVCAECENITFGPFRQWCRIWGGFLHQGFRGDLERLSECIEAEKEEK